MNHLLHPNSRVTVYQKAIHERDNRIHELVKRTAQLATERDEQMRRANEAENRAMRWQARAALWKAAAKRSFSIAWQLKRHRKELERTRHLEALDK